MKATVTKKDLVRALERCNAAIEPKGAMPIWQNVKIDVSTEFRVTAQCVERSVVGSVPARDLSVGSVLVDAKGLLERVRAMQDGDLHIAKKKVGNEYALVIKSPISSRKFQIRTLDVDDYRLPEEPDSCLPTVVIPSSILASVIAATRLAISKEESRIALASLLFEFGKGFIRCVATDGKRMNVTQADIECDEESSFLVRSQGVESLRRLLDSSENKVTIRIGRANVFVDADGFRFGMRLTDAQFPPWEQVLPKPSETYAIVARGGMVDSVRNVAVSANQFGGVTIGVDADMLSLETSNPDHGDGEDKISAEHIGTVKTGADYLLLIDALNSCGGEKVRIEFGGELDPIVIKPEPQSSGFEVTAVVMPMRI